MKAARHTWEKIALAFVCNHPGTSMRAVIACVAEARRAASESTVSSSAAAELLTREDTRSYRQARSIVERMIKDRHVRQAPNLGLHPWDEKRKTYAEALERALFAAPTPAEYATIRQLACEAWSRAGDENRARTLRLLPSKTAEGSSASLGGSLLAVAGELSASSAEAPCSPQADSLSEAPCSRHAADFPLPRLERSTS